MRKLDAITANQIWNILVEHCGAPKQEKTNFMYTFVTPSTNNYDKGAPREYRICQRFGFAGKFWWNHDRFYVTGHSPNEIGYEACRAEDEILEPINNMLDNVFQEFSYRRQIAGMLEAIPAFPQHQGSVTEQLQLLQSVADKIGLQDAADFIRNSLER